MSIHEEITAKIVAMIEAGVRPWAPSWDAEGTCALPRRVNGELYSGINILLLWSAASEHGFKSSQWMTFNQAKELGGSVRKGSKGSKVVYASTFTKEVEGEDKEIPFLKQYTVFNVEQIDGLPERFYGKPVSLAQHDRIEAAECFLLRTGVRLQHGGGQAFYVPSQDYIQMPELGRFDSAVSYYATLAHESIHATRHETRLNRDFGRKRFGDEGYAMEELVAEMGAAFICAELGLSVEPRADHASYLASWLKVLKNDSRAIFTAASYASKACDKLREMVAAYVEPEAPTPAPTRPTKRRQRVSASNVVAMVARKPREAVAASLCEYLASHGGMMDQGRELSAIDAHHWHRAKAFRARLVREDGMTLATAAERAWEAGYFPNAVTPFDDFDRGDYHPVTVAMLLQAIARELAHDYPALVGAEMEEPADEDAAWWAGLEAFVGEYDLAA